ncbi:hypothetical protein MMC15_003634 [Xylographa vitiligo]|nr:hypothetical protein [Xylographa vitiligo]
MASALQCTGRGPFSFFWLPAEVRYLIYQQLFDAQEDGAINVLNLDPFHKIVPIFPSILRTCRTIYAEAVDILYNINKFLFDTVHRQPLAPLEVLFGGIRTTDLLQHVQLLVSGHELISETAPKRHHTYRLVKELSRSERLRGSFSIAFQQCWALNDTPIPVDVTNILVRSIQSLHTYKEVVIVGLPFDDHGHPAKMIWSEAFRRELESGLGPNRSLTDTRLEFRPQSKPGNWNRENISPLMRLPFPVRSRITGLVLGPEAFFYPSQPLFEMQQSGHRTDWGMITIIARCNPGRCIQLLFSCRKLWEEGWQHILLRRRIIFDFDFDVVDEPTNHDLTFEQNGTWLPNTTVNLHNIDNSTDLWGTFQHLGSILKGLSRSSRSPFVRQAVPKRGHLIIKIGIHQMRWRRYPHDQKLHLTRKDHKPYRKSQHRYYYYTECHGVPYINARNGHDIEIANYLKRMTHWRRLEIVLLPETLKSRCWRREVTDFLEDTLGPQISSRRGFLSFRPRYFHDLTLYLEREAAYEFMLGRKHFSEDVMDDLLENRPPTSDEAHDKDTEESDESNSNSGNGKDRDSDDDGDDTNDDGGHASNSLDIEPGAHHQSLINDADWHRRAIEAINEFELEEALRLSAAEAVDSRDVVGPEDEQQGTDDEGTV